MRILTSLFLSLGSHRAATVAAKRRATGRSMRAGVIGLLSFIVAATTLGTISAPVAQAADEGIYGLTTTNASTNITPIGGVNNFQAVLNPLATTTQLTVSFDTGSLGYAVNGTSGSLTSGVPSAQIAIPIGVSDIVLTFTASTSDQSVYHVFVKRPIPIGNLWFEGTTSSSPTNYDASTTVTVPVTPVFDANRTWTDENGRPSFSVTVPHGVVKGRLVWSYSRAGEQGVSAYSVSFDGIRGKQDVYDAGTGTGTITTDWTDLSVGSTRFVIYSGTVIPSGDVNTAYATFINRSAALDVDAVSALALHSSDAQLSATSALYTWTAMVAPLASSTHLNATFASGAASYSVNGQTGVLSSGVDSSAINVPVGVSEIVMTYTPTSGSPIIYHVFVKRPIPISGLRFEGTTSSSPTNYDASTTVTVPVTPVFDANRTWTDENGRPSFSVTVPHGVVKGRLVWSYSRAGEQGVSAYSVSFDGIRGKQDVYDAGTGTGTITTDWTDLGVGSTRFVVYSGTVIPSGDVNTAYATFINRSAALDVDAVSALALHSSDAQLSATSALYTWTAMVAPLASSTHLNATFASGAASYSVNGQTGVLSSGVDSSAISVPVGVSEIVMTYTPTSGSPIIYHVFVKRPIPISGLRFEGTTSSSPTNYDASTTVTVPVTPVFDANRTWTDENGRPSFSVTVPHGVVKGRLVWSYSRAGEQGVSAYSVSFDGIRGKQDVYDAGTGTGTITTDWTDLGVGSTRFVVYSGTVIPSGDVNTAYATFVERRPATVVPGPPIIREAAPVDTSSALVTWDAPLSDGGESISSYTVTASQVSAPTGISPRSFGISGRSNSVADVPAGTCVTSTTSCVVLGLVTGATYTFAVTARNLNGDGLSSAPTAPIVVLVAPNAPTGASATPGDASAIVTWSASSADGGSPILGYTVTSSPGGFTCDPPSLAVLSCSVSGLTNGTAYTFTVIARNAVGSSSASSASTPITPISATPDPSSAPSTAPSGSAGSDPASGGTQASVPMPDVSPSGAASPPPSTTPGPGDSPASSLPAGVAVLSGTERANAQIVAVKGSVSTNVANAPEVSVVTGASVAPVVSGLPPNTPLEVGMSVAPLTRVKTSFVSIGKTRSTASGRAKVPAFKASRPGVYTIRLSTPAGKAFYLKVKVSAKKASSSSASSSKVSGRASR